MLYDTIINGVASKVVNRKSDGKTITIFEVTDSTGTIWATTRKDLATEAQRLIGRGVQIQGEARQNGNFTNHYLEGISPVGEHPAHYESEQFPVPPSQRPAAPQTPPAAPPQAPPPAQPEIPQLPREGEGTPKDWAIWRQAATKVAAHISASPAEFWDNVDKLVRFYAYNQKPAIPTPATSTGNQFIPETAVAAAIAGDPGPDHEREFTDDDIPF